MDYNPLITSKLNALLFKCELKGRSVSFVNLLGHTITLDLPKKHKYSQRLYLFKDGKRLRKSEQKQFSQCYKLENYMLNHLDLQTYKRFHQLNPDLLFYDIMDKKPDYVLDQKSNVEHVLQTYRDQLKIKKHRLCFYYYSTGLDSINVLNHIAADYPLIKQGYKYTIHLNQNQLQVTTHVKRILESTNKETTNYMLF